MTAGIPVLAGFVGAVFASGFVGRRVRGYAGGVFSGEFDECLHQARPN